VGGAHGAVPGGLCVRRRLALGLYADGIMVGFAMWTTDPGDGSYWIGGFLIDQRHQRRGFGHAAMAALIAFLRDEHHAHQIALSYAPDNEPARRLYASFGFSERGELEGTEKVARLDLPTRDDGLQDPGEENPSIQS
jgi:RimJ/RimL family protein N-acetyltransferase